MNHEHYLRVQSAARSVLKQVSGFIQPDSTELSIASTCIELLAKEGITETWYYSTPAFVLLGSRSCLSISGREYVASSEQVGEHNLITIDLSPSIGTIWGDMARSFAVEVGAITSRPKNKELSDGFIAEEHLHRTFRDFVRPESTFEDVFVAMNQEIVRLGFTNLDFMGNVGHSIVERRDDRIYFENGNKHKLSEVSYFTFEPHIRRIDGRWGFKHENIYFFNSDGIVCEL